MNKKQIKKKYEKLLHDVENNPYYDIDLTNRVNVYSCQGCDNVIKSKDIHAGVTPFMILCPSCGDSMHSNFYNDKLPDQEPTHEWYRPSLEETLAFRNKEWGEGMIDHILKGGLELREIK